MQRHDYQTGPVLALRCIRPGGTSLVGTSRRSWASAGAGTATAHVRTTRRLPAAIVVQALSFRPGCHPCGRWLMLQTASAPRPLDFHRHQSCRCSTGSARQSTGHRVGNHSCSFAMPMPLGWPLLSIPSCPRSCAVSELPRIPQHRPTKTPAAKIRMAMKMAPLRVNQTNVVGSLIVLSPLRVKPWLFDRASCAVRQEGFIGGFFRPARRWNEGSSLSRSSCVPPAQHPCQRQCRGCSWPYRSGHTDPPGHGGTTGRSRRAAGLRQRFGLSLGVIAKKSSSSSEAASLPVRSVGVDRPTAPLVLQFWSAWPVSSSSAAASGFWLIKRTLAWPRSVAPRRKAGGQDRVATRGDQAYATMVESFFLAPTVAYITDWLARTSTTFWFAGCLMSSVRERWRTSLSPELIDD